MKGYYAGKFGGQYIVVIPELDIIIVTTSEMDKPHQENKRLISNISSCMRKNDKMSKRKNKKQLLSNDERTVPDILGFLKNGVFLEEGFLKKVS
ncbi:MAG: hypothetical protein JXB88_24325 [Spirochaetales bacterium]|nr:hypothetical protein [Spirochaetales bacterium]